MSYEEKGAWISLTVVLGAYVAYIAVILGRADGIPLAQVAYVTPILWLAGISAALNIVGRVVVATAKPSESTKPDVRDRDIKRLGGYVGGMVLAVAMVLPFALALNKVSQFWIANAIYAAFVAAVLATTLVRIVAYRRGL